MRKFPFCESDFWFVSCELPREFCRMRLQNQNVEGEYSMKEKSIGSFITILRKAKGMTQKDLAELLNVSDKAVSRWEREESMPDISLIPVLAEIFEVSCDELLRGERILNERPAESDEKKERRLRQLFKNRRNHYLTLSIIPVGLSLLGLLAAAFLNFVFYKGVTAFYAAAAVFLVAGILQMIFFFYFKGETDTEELAGDALQEYKKALKDQLWKTFGVLLVLTGFCLPLIFKGRIDFTETALQELSINVEIGLSLKTWLTYGCIGALVVGFLWFLANILLNEKKPFALIKKEMILLAVLLTVTAAGAGIFWKVMPEYAAEGREFTSYEDFTRYMETPPVTMSTGTIALRRQLDKYQKVLYGEQGEVLCDYTALNDDVVKISYGKEQKLPITVYTEDAMQEARQKTDAWMGIWWLLMCAEAAGVMLLCKRK